MLKANIKSAFFAAVFLTALILTGCSSPEEKRAAQIEEAITLAENGNYAEALKILDELSKLYPNDIEILSTMGQIHSEEGDATMAAFFIEQAYLQSPDDTERLYQAYLSLERAGQPAAHLLEKLAKQSPESMTPELWVRLGQMRQRQNKIQPALDAYLKGVDPENVKPSPEVAASIGRLFVQLDNLPQAEAWLEIAADSDDPNAMTALFGLLEINLRQKDWAEAETTLSQLDKQFPGAVEASQWNQAREELIRWRKAQDQMKAKLAKAEAERRAAAKKAAAEAKAAAAAKKVRETATLLKYDGNKVATDPKTEGKAQVIADMEAAEAMADMPAIEAPEAAIAFNPNIAIEPADPSITFDVSFDEEDVAQETNFSVTQAPANKPAEPLETEAISEVDDAANFSTFGLRPDPEPIDEQRPKSVDELLAEAETAELDRDYKSAIRKYWAAISVENNRADVWNLLSRAYLVDGQRNNAETAALEAVRLAPREVAYTLDYLRVAQRSKTPTDFLTDLDTAYARFPDSPEITLSLARAHERITKQAPLARDLYQRFIDIAPNHPLVPEAREAVARLP